MTCSCELQAGVHGFGGRWKLSALVRRQPGSDLAGMSRKQAAVTASGGRGIMLGSRPLEALNLAAGSAAHCLTAAGMLPNAGSTTHHRIHRPPASSPPARLGRLSCCGAVTAMAALAIAATAAVAVAALAIIAAATVAMAERE